MSLFQKQEFFKNPYKKKKIVLAVTGATGIIYAKRLLEVLKDNLEVETHLILSPSAKLTIKLECDFTSSDLKELADYNHNYKDIADELSSGSVRTDGMVILPCSIKTLSAVANSYNEDLITRCADVHLKEGRRLILCVRETPLHLGHLRLLTSCAEYGAMIMPLMPAFYHHPQTIDDIVNQGVARILDKFDIEYPKSLFTPWNGGKEEEKEYFSDEDYYS